MHPSRVMQRRQGCTSQVGGGKGEKFADRTRRGETGCVVTARLHGGTRHVPCTGIRTMVDLIIVALDCLTKTEKLVRIRSFPRISKFEAIVHNRRFLIHLFFIPLCLWVFSSLFYFSTFLCSFIGQRERDELFYVGARGRMTGKKSCNIFGMFFNRDL